MELKLRYIAVIIILSVLIVSISDVVALDNNSDLNVVSDYDNSYISNGSTINGDSIIEDREYENIDISVSFNSSIREKKDYGSDFRSTITASSNDCNDIQNAISSASNGDTINLRNSRSTITVSGNNFIDIQNAINSASNGDTINLGSSKVYTRGTFTTGYIGFINVNKMLNFIGSNVVLDSQNGGGIFYIPETVSQVSIAGIIFKNGYRIPSGLWIGGSAIHAKKNTKVIISSCQFDKNTANGTIQGGSIYIGPNCELTCNNCNFTNNSINNPWGGGGAIFAENATLTLMNCNFINNTANYRGGGVFGLYLLNANIKNCNFINNSATRLSGGLALIDLENASVKNKLVENCVFDSNVAAGKYDATAGEYIGGSEAAFGIHNAIIRNCSIINNYSPGSDIEDSGTGSSVRSCDVYDCYFNNNKNKYGHAAGMCTHNTNGVTSNVYNCVFSNNNALFTGAVYTHDGSLLKNCTFFNNSANRIKSPRNSSYIGGEGGAVGAAGDSINIKNCTFYYNIASKGAAIMIGGLPYPYMEGTTYGNNANISDCYIYNNIATQEGGAVHITGNNASFQNSVFINNTAKNGDGGAIYIKGDNSVILNNTFTNHKNLLHGTIYVIGSNTLINKANFTDNNAIYGAGVYINGYNTKIVNSFFEKNNASYAGGVYIIGDKAVISNSNFSDNNVSVNGGAVYIEGSNAKIKSSNFLKNNAIPSVLNLDDGLGGAIYIKGDNNAVEDSLFDNNTARNGSAIYTDGINFVINNTKFNMNQAWSYLLNISVEPSLSYYMQSNQVINVTHIGGNNIANAIYNTVLPSQIFFYNVTYTTSKFGLKTTGASEIHPVLGAENSQDGLLLYQDNREDYQRIHLKVINVETGDVVYDNNNSEITGIYGNISAILSGLTVGNYSVNVSHEEDPYYKAIINSTIFKILPIVDIDVVKNSDKNIYFLNETVLFTITVSNKGLNNATGVVLKDILPNGLKYISHNATKGSYNYLNGLWTIGELNKDSVVFLTILAQATKLGYIVNNANVSANEAETNYTNNFANKTIEVTLFHEKTVDNDNPLVDQVIKYNLTVTNVGNSTYIENITLIDDLPEGLEYAGNFTIIGGTLINFINNGKKLIWIIKDIYPNTSAIITVSIKVMNNGTWVNNLTINNVTVNETVNVPEVVPGKTVNNTSPNFGDKVSYTVTVSNDGSADSNNLVALVSSVITMKSFMPRAAP